MKTISRSIFAGMMVAAVLLSSAFTASAQKSKAAGIKVPVTYYKRTNGLKVVLSPETSASFDDGCGLLQQR